MNNKENTELTTVVKNPIEIGSHGLALRSLDDGWRFAQMVARSGFAPKGMQTPDAILVAVQMGMEVGMPPMTALQNTAVINGRPAIYGDAALALVRGSGLCEAYEQEIAGEGDGRYAVVKVKRKGDPKAIAARFSVADAKRAGLWGKPGPWAQYPDRMLLFRARGFALRDGFGDVLKGLRTVEEERDVPAESAVAVAVAAEEAKPAMPTADKALEIEADTEAPEAHPWRVKLFERLAKENRNLEDVEQLAHMRGHLPKGKELREISEKGARLLAEANLDRLLGLHPNEPAIEIRREDEPKKEDAQ